jgi:hypothetical protein
MFSLLVMQLLLALVAGKVWQGIGSLSTIRLKLLLKGTKRLLIRQII